MAQQVFFRLFCSAAATGSASLSQLIMERDVSRGALPSKSTWIPRALLPLSCSSSHMRLPWTPGCNESMGTLPHPTSNAIPPPPIAALILVYSVPAVLIFSVCCIVRWRPCSQMTSAKQCFKWYILCFSKESIEEMRANDRQNILPIDVQSLASLVSETEMDELAATTIL